MVKMLRNLKTRALNILLRRKASGLKHPGVEQLARERGLAYEDAEKLARKHGLNTDNTSSWNMIKNGVPRDTQREILNLKRLKKEAEQEK